ncbi:hypothetical protein BS78_K232500 [Paspalum vaginatum]|uniref:Squalene cyclase C-terminal domain-containing protein n=1 Tax=Paspalum vaginatum TaxID=158149 RepID=A0A9W8CDA3_9POAL|nr:hypothetical protein BS78_K232500 [Paspalum vaginatum]
MYSPHSLVQGMSWAFLHKFVEPIMFHWPGRKLREKALAMAIRHVHYEDECTHYINLGAVPKALSMLACWIEDPDSEAFKCHIARVYDYLWVAEDGMKMQIYDGSQVWDAGFTVEALLATGLIKELGPTLKRAHAFLKNSQLLENFPGDLNYWYRHISKGGWTFTTADDGWLVSDCTGTALKACLLLSNISPKIVGEPMEIDRQYDGINCLMSFLNDNGGFRHLNSYGSWGVCFTYGTWFAVAGLVCAGRIFTNSATIRKACDFLLSKELPSGGWGESYLSAHIVVYTNLKGNRPHGTHTAWAVLALLDAGQAEIDPALLHRGARVLLNLQLEDGEFPQKSSESFSKLPWPVTPNIETYIQYGLSLSESQWTGSIDSGVMSDCQQKPKT